MKALKNYHNYINFQNKKRCEFGFTIKHFLIFFEISSPARRDSGTASYATISFYVTLNQTAQVFWGTPGTTFCAFFVFWGRFFQYFVDFEAKFAESFFLKSII
jgi:hypothetical protein